MPPPRLTRLEPGSVSRLCPVVKSPTCTVPSPRASAFGVVSSPLAVARKLLSGLKAAHQTTPVCPHSSARLVHLPPPTSQTRAVLFSVVVTRSLPLGLKAAQRRTQ